MSNTITIRKYSQGYKGNYAYYTGTGATQLVPYVYPVAINGRPYMLDVKSGDFTRQFDARTRNSVDQSQEPGEGAINAQGFWRRSQSSWNYGTGQKYADTNDAEASRFYDSKGVDVWTRGELSLLNDVKQIKATSSSSIKAVVAGTRLYQTIGAAAQYTTNMTSWNDCTGEPGGDISAMCSDGYNTYFAFVGSGVHITNNSTAAITGYISGTDTYTLLAHVKGRLFATKENAIWSWLTGGGAGTNLFAQNNTDFEWVGVCGGQNYIYFGGHSGNQSLIYKSIIKTDATALDAPSVAAELPRGEIITGMATYLDYVLIGTTKGFRVATADTNGNLLVGVLNETKHSVGSFVPIGRFVYFNLTNFDSTSTGLGRIDLSTFISTNQPAWASDLMVTGQGTTNNANEFLGTVVFSATGYGLYSTDLTKVVPTGYLRSGIFRWGVPDAKFIPKWDIRTKPLVGTVAISVSNDTSDFETIGTASVAGEKSFTFDGVETKMFEAEAQLVLTRSDTDTSQGPTVTRWMSKAYAAPLRSKIFQVPLLLHHKLNIRGQEVFCDVDGEIAYLEDLVENPRIVTYQENFQQWSVIVEDIMWKPNDSSFSHNRWDWNGTLTVIMRSVR